MNSSLRKEPARYSSSHTHIRNAASSWRCGSSFHIWRACGEMRAEVRDLYSFTWWAKSPQPRGSVKWLWEKGESEKVWLIFLGWVEMLCFGIMVLWIRVMIYLVFDFCTWLGEFTYCQKRSMKYWNLNYNIHVWYKYKVSHLNQTAITLIVLKIINSFLPHDLPLWRIC